MRKFIEKNQEEFSISTDDPEPEEAPLNVSQLKFEPFNYLLLGLERVCNDFGQFRFDEFNVQ